MRATGIIRRIDDLGRVVIPKEIRRQMRSNVGDPLEIFTDRDGCVIFKKYQNDELAPLGESIVVALRAQGITASVYNRDGDKVAGNGDWEIPTDIDDPCIFAVQGECDVIGFIATKNEPSAEDRVAIAVASRIAGDLLKE
jgi:AbrB family looped-hinge helix DNA binding protein